MIVSHNETGLSKDTSYMLCDNYIVLADMNRNGDEYTVQQAHHSMPLILAG